MIHRAARALILERVGEDGWRDVLEKSGLSDDCFLSARAYDDEITWALIAAAGRETHQGQDEFLRSLGEYWINFADQSRFRAMMTLAGGDLHAFLGNLDRMHTEVNIALPGARMPSFRVIATSPDRVRVAYGSTRRGLTPFVVGLLHGLLRRFGLTGAIDLVALSDGGAEFEISRIAAGP